MGDYTAQREYDGRWAIESPAGRRIVWLAECEGRAAEVLVAALNQRMAIIRQRIEECDGRQRVIDSLVSDLYVLDDALGIPVEMRTGLSVRLRFIRELTADRDCWKAEAKRLGGLLADVGGVIKESFGIDGWHLNGAVAPWGEFDWAFEVEEFAKDPAAGT